MQKLLRLIVMGILLSSVITTTAMAESGDDQISALINALGDANVRKGASIALIKIGSEAVPALQKSLKAGRRNVPIWSAYTLGEIGLKAKPAVGELIQALSHKDEELRAAAAQALGKVDSDAIDAVEPLANALSDKNEKVRRNAAIALGEFGPTAERATKKLIGVLSDSQLRAIVRTSLTRIGRAAIKPLQDALDDDNLRFDVSIIIKAIDPKAAKQLGLDKASTADLASLKLVLHDLTRLAEERRRAAIALATVGKKGVPILIAAFENEKAARTAAEAFEIAGPAAVPALIEVMESENPKARATAADAVGHIGPQASDATSKLIALLKDEDRNVRYRAVRALHTFGAKATPAIPELIEVIKDPKEQEMTQQWSIKTMIVTLPKTHDVVIKALIAASKDKRNYGVSSLARQQVRRLDLEAAEAAGVK